MHIPKPGDILSNDKLRESFNVGNMGGMRKSNKNNLLLLGFRTFKISLR